MPAYLTTLLTAGALALLPLGEKANSQPRADGAKAGPIVDRAEIFSPEAKREVARRIEEIERDKNIEIRVETFETPPSVDPATVREMSARERARFFSEWLKQLSSQREAKGVFILICKDPSHLRVGVSRELYRRGFRDAERDATTNRLLSAFRERDFDRGLRDAVDYIGGALDEGRSVVSGNAVPAARRADRRRAEPAAPGAIGSGLGGLLCVGLLLALVVGVVMMLVGMFRRRSTDMGGYGQQPYGGQYVRGPYQGGYGGPPAGGMGGGLFGGLMSGLGGALLGNWMYDRFRGPQAHGAGGHSPTDPASGTGFPQADDPRYGDFTSSGGDFGDSAGGDWGGDDFGGSDDGGGDF